MRGVELAVFFLRGDELADLIEDVLRNIFIFCVLSSL